MSLVTLIYAWNALKGLSVAFQVKFCVFEKGHPYCIANSFVRATGSLKERDELSLEHLAQLFLVSRGRRNLVSDR